MGDAVPGDMVTVSPNQIIIIFSILRSSTYIVALIKRNGYQNTELNQATEDVNAVQRHWK